MARENPRIHGNERGDRSRASASSGILTDIASGAAIAILIAVAFACLVEGTSYLSSLVGFAKIGQLFP